MKRGYQSKRIYRVRCKSGIRGFRCRLQTNYNDFQEWESFSADYNLATRLGYKSTKAAWEANPVIEGSISPGDLRCVKT